MSVAFYLGKATFWSAVFLVGPDGVSVAAVESFAACYKTLADQSLMVTVLT